MRLNRASLLALLMLATTVWSPMASADRGRGYGSHNRNDWSHNRHDWSHDRHYRSNHRHRDDSGAALGAGLLLGASLLWLANQPSPPPPQRVVVLPPAAPVIITPPAPRLAPPPPEVWYYCRSTGAYYPYAQTCATPWEVVPVQ